ncbi:NF-kappa-B inhibitor-like protein 1 [Styela clava]
MNSDQRKLVKYIQSGSLLKIKSLLEKLNGKREHKFNLGFKIGDLNRTPLHIACLLGDDAVVRCLLKYGASSDRKDKNNDTPVHIAAQFICDDGNYQDYKLLIEPLIQKQPELLSQKNKKGKTPSEILLQAREKYKMFCKFDQEEEDLVQEKAEQEESWNSKLLQETESEYNEQTKGLSFSSNISSFSDDDYQNYDQWAGRIFRDYQRKNIGMENKKRRKEFQSRKRREEFDDVSAHLRKNNSEYVSQVKRMKTEVLAQKRERYEKKMTSMKSPSDDKLRFRDIPWPCQGNATEMVEVLLSGQSVDSSSNDRKRAIIRQLVLWHPDKFEQKCGERLSEKDRDRILDTVKAIAQELNKNLESLKAQES